MKYVDIQATLRNVSILEITEQTTNTDASASMKIIGNFNQCMVGLVCFSGLTPWERHPDDELLHILEGEVDVKVLLEDGGYSEITLQSGTIFTVPRGLWHNQHSHQGVKLLFVTSQQGNEESTLEDPRLHLPCLSFEG